MIHSLFGTMVVSCVKTSLKIVSFFIWKNTSLLLSLLVLLSSGIILALCAPPSKKTINKGPCLLSSSTTYFVAFFFINQLELFFFPSSSSLRARTFNKFCPLLFSLLQSKNERFFCIVNTRSVSPDQVDLFVISWMRTQNCAVSPLLDEFLHSRTPLILFLLCASSFERWISNEPGQCWY